MIKIDGRELPAPTDYAVGIMDIDAKTQRTASGLMVRDRIATKRKIELMWKHLSRDELSRVLNAVSPVFFNVEYIDPQGGKKTGTFYSGDRTAGAIDYVDGQVRWKDIKFNIIEQ